LKETFVNRKEFLAGASATAAIVLVRNIGWAAQQPAEAKPAAPAPSGTPVQEKYAFSQGYIKRLMDVIDQQLTPEQRTALMEANGRACYRNAHGTGKLPGGLDELVRRIQGYGPDIIRREGNTIHFRYVQNPAGLKVEDGYRLCPLVEQGPPGLSGTFCQCSVGYVREMFSSAAGKPVKVELTESLKRGGKSCRFVIQV
jgi:hypothetical protein